MTIEEMNHLVMERLSLYLNQASRFITADMVEELVRDFSMDRESAFRLLLTGALDLPEDRLLQERYIDEAVHMLNPEVYRQDPYYRNIRLPKVRDGAWELKMEEYEPYECFVCNDLRRMFDGRVLPSIGFFAERYSYPCVLQDGREWMLITPNEIETMREAIASAQGHVLTYGLGLGYFTYMAAQKPETADVTVVERDPEVIRLFETYILPQFSCREKVKIICADALEVSRAIHEGRGDEWLPALPDFVFADLWHDPSDGVDLYLSLKKDEVPGTTYRYWIEDTLRFYL